MEDLKKENPASNYTRMFASTMNVNFVAKVTIAKAKGEGFDKVCPLCLTTAQAIFI